jgi:hypothetical protein
MLGSRKQIACDRSADRLRFTIQEAKPLRAPESKAAPVADLFGESCHDRTGVKMSD